VNALSDACKVFIEVVAVVMMMEMLTVV